MYRVRSLFMALLISIWFFSIAGCAETTASEAAAISAAKADPSAYILSPDKAVKAEALYRIRALSKIGTPLVNILALFLILQLRIAAGMRDVARKLSGNRWAQGFTFFFLFLLLITLVTLPLDVYLQHVRIGDGISIQSWANWWGDQAKSFALVYAFGGLGVMVLFFLIPKSPRKWWLWLWFPVATFGVLSVFVGPYLVDPLFNKFEPLSKSNPTLVAQLELVVGRSNSIKIPPDRMFVMKASDKVTSLNAYVTGFGDSKRIVVWDTMIAKASPDQILPLFGHEMGHYVLGHIAENLAFSCVFIFVSFYVGFHLFGYLLDRFGGRWHVLSQEDWAALAIFVMVITLISFMGDPIQNAFTRPQEHAADVYGEEIVHGIVSNPQASHQAALQLLGESNLATANPSPFVEFWTDAAPPISFRTAFVKHYDPWTSDARPKYFSKDWGANLTPVP